MKMYGKLSLIMLLSLLTLSVFSMLGGGRFEAFAQPASLTGIAHDGGIDTDADGDFDYLGVGVGVNVEKPGYYTVSISGLEDSSYHYISVSDSESLFLDIGSQTMNLSLSGQTICASGVNPSHVSYMTLYDANWTWLGSMNHVPLSKEYERTDFDPPAAYLTGTIDDEGVDTDGDEKFDHLEVRVEVDVKEAGLYQVYISGLRDSVYIPVYDSGFSELDVGLHFITVKLHGPTIYSSGANPVMVSSIYLYEMQYLYTGWLGSIHDVPLSHQYFYYQFNPPFADMEAKLTVYPDGRVVMGGTLDYTPLPTAFQVYEVFGDTSFTRTDGSTEMSANFAFIVQPQYAEIPLFNDSSFILVGTYSDGMADITIDGSVTFPPSVASQFPLNLSDFTVVADYLNNEITGTITAPLISGMPVATIDVDFHGNLTDLYLSDELEIVYGTFFDYEIDEAFVEEQLLYYNSTIPGTGPGSLYEATHGILECTYLNTTMTTKDGGATITFDAHIHGDFVQLFVYAMTGMGNPGLYCFSKALVSSVETGHFELAYAHEFGEASMKLTFTANFTKLWSDLESTLPEVIPPEQRAPVEFLLNTTLCSVDSADVSWTYEDGRSDLNINATIGPDLNAELNFIKNVFVTYGMPQPPPLEWQFINGTEIDLSNLKFTFSLTRTSAQGTIEGFAIKPPTDPTDSDPTQFKLERLLSLTKYAFPYGEPPVKDTRLKITIEGGYNATHIVTLIRPATVPEPDITSPDQTSMVWLNQSVSSLKDLIFDIRYQGVFDWEGVSYRVIFDSNSTVTDFNFNRDAKQFSFDVEGSTGTVGYCNISIPRALLYASPDKWIITIGGGPPLEYLIDYIVTETETHTFIYFTYEHSSQTITITGTTVIREFDTIVLRLTLMILTLTATALAIKQRKKLVKLKTKYQNVIRIFTSKLH